MNVLIVSEGRSEYLDALSTHRSADKKEAGALKTLVSRLLQDASKWQIEEDRVSSPNVRSHHGKGRGYAKRCIRWLLEAERRGFDAVVMLVDRDGLEARQAEVNEAQETALTTIRRALGVAVESFDAWMLADHVALTKVLGFTVQRQSDPEKQSDAKGMCRDLFAQAATSETHSKRYAAISAIANLDELLARCPNGFTPFAERIRSL